MALLRGSHFAPCLVPPFFPSTPIDLASTPSQFPPNHATSCHHRIVVVDGRTCRRWNACVVDRWYVFSMGRTHSYWAVPVVDRAYAWREGQKWTTTKVVVCRVSTGIRRQWAGIGGKTNTTFIVVRFCDTPAGPPTSWVPPGVLLVISPHRAWRTSPTCDWMSLVVNELGRRDVLWL